MAAANSATVPPLLSIDQYLSTTYRPDVDYIDGYIEERNLGETDHAKLQTRLAVFLCRNEEEWGTVAMAEVRVQVSPTRFRIPDVCVVREGDANEPIVTAAPLLCLEVLSPRDSDTSMRRRAQNYFDMGVPEIWIFDPQTRNAYICTAESMTEQAEGILRLSGTEIEISIAEVFKTHQRTS